MLFITHLLLKMCEVNKNIGGAQMVQNDSKSVLEHQCQDSQELHGSKIVVGSDWLGAI